MTTKLSEMVKAVFFSHYGKAMGSSRFANGDWTDVNALIPIFEPLLQAHGTVPTVADAWMTLCETSFESYPVEHFVENLHHLFGPKDDAVGWRQTQLPARLAGLVQRFSEKKQPLPLAMAQELLRALDKLVAVFSWSLFLTIKT